MASYTEAAANVRRAREARDAARAALHKQQLRRLALGRAIARDARGEGKRDPAADAELRSLRAAFGATEERSAVIATKLAALVPLDAELTRLTRRLEAASTAANALAREVSRLAAALANTEPGKAEGLGESVKRKQSQRAALAAAASKDRAALAEARAARDGADPLRKEAAALKTRAQALREELDAAERRAAQVNLDSASEKTKGDVAEAKGDKARRDAELRAAIDTLFGELGPQKLIESWDDSLPITLLPLRIETRWKTDRREGGAELWVRVYPDDVCVNNHEPVLTDAELEHGARYWSSYRTAADDAERGSAWKVLATRFGGNRAAWVAKQTCPLNWDAALADGTLSLDFPVQETKPSAWTTAPHSRVLPERFVLMAWRGDQQRILKVGEPVDDIVVLGPSPVDAPDEEASISRDVADNSLKFGDAFEWVRDFPRAVACGMAFRIPLKADDVTGGFDRLMVLGLKLSADAPEAQAMLEALVDDHHYSIAGFELLRQGTPTNNTDGNDSGYVRGGETGVAGAGPERFTPRDDRSAATDGQRFADFLGIDYASLLHVDGAQNTDHAEAVAMSRALYAGTLGYYCDQMLTEVIDSGALGALRSHFTKLVTGRGPVAAFRVGSQPYGVLPTSSLSRWRPHGRRVDGPNDAVIADPFESGLLRVLRAFDAAWSSKLPDVAHLGGAGAASGAANLLEVLGLQPTSAEFYQRVGYSYDYLRNLEAFTSGGADAADVIKMFIEGMGSRALLQSLGYTPQRDDGAWKPLPALLQLIWRHYQTTLDPKQLIDGQPLSEKTTIKPYDNAGSTYIDWLLAHASDPSALEAQSFGGAARPGALLYMLLHFALVMEGGRAIHQFLGANAIAAEELVRSRKFLNVGGTSPSVWEVFRAPANKIVSAAKSVEPLLTLMHGPQVATGAGAGIQEQKAALTILRTLPTARLERALVEHLDTLSYRLDAWETSLFTRRLQQQRRLDLPSAQRRTGGYLGAFGYLERVRPGGSVRTQVRGEVGLFREAGNGGYVHAPSLNHATAAALLRNGYLTHASPTDPDALAVNLSSGRVQRARHLIEGIRNGQTLETLLGVQFERGLHDWTTRTPNPVILDQLKPVFRAKFPIVRTRVPQANDAAAGATEAHEDHQVVNGLTLALTKTPFPYGIAELSTLSVEQQNAIGTEQEAIKNALDALRDVLTAESAYQLALGNFDRAAAVLQSTGSGTLPPDIEVLNTPRGTGISFTQRLVVQFDSGLAGNPWAPIALSERARLEAPLNAWLGDLLGTPDSICCRVAAVDAAGTVLSDAGGPIEDTISLAALELQPIDFVYIVRAQAEASGAAELETRVRHRFATDRALADDVIVRIAFADAGGAAGARSFAEVLPLADRLRKLLGTARALDARHFESASKDTPPSPDNPGRIDTVELRTRVGTQIAAVRALFPLLAAAANTARASTLAAEIAALRDALIAVARTGFGYAMPRSVTGSAPEQRDALVAQADALVKRAATLDAATTKQLADAAAATSAEQVVSLLGAVVKTWMGSDMILLTRFAYGDVAAVQQADAARETLLAHARTAGSPLPVEEWLHGAACVRSLVHDFEMVRSMADASRALPLSLAALQLPFRSGDSWLGAEYPPTMEVLHDTVSMVQHLPQGLAPAAPQCGLLLDEWVESVPTREEVTGLTFNFNAPNSAPPQTLLLAISPNETGSWSWDDLVDTVLDTFRRAKLRAVEPDSFEELPGIGTLLPAVVAEFSTSAASVSLDYSLVMAEIRLPVFAMEALNKGGE